MKKPTYQKWMFGAVIAVLLTGALGCSNDPKQQADPVSKVEAAPEKEADNASDNKQDKEEVKEPTEEEWQANYKDILLSEARTYIELTVKGTLSEERFESAVGVLKQQVEKITGPDQEKFNELFKAVEKGKLNKAKKLYISLGGDDFEELHKEQKDAPKEDNPPTISKAEFDKIKNGMTYKQVTKIIGGPGEVLSEAGEEGTEFYTVMYMYEGEGSLGANANFMFQGGKLQSKAQFGLE